MDEKLQELQDELCRKDRTSFIIWKWVGLVIICVSLLVFLGTLKSGSQEAFMVEIGIAFIGIVLVSIFFPLDISTKNRIIELEKQIADIKEKQRWDALTPEEQEKEQYAKYRAAFNLPLKCPRCDQEAKWRYADSEEKETFDSAYTIGGNTTVYMKKNVTRRFVCDKCGFDIKRTS